MTEQTVTLKLVGENGQLVATINASNGALKSFGATAERAGNQARAGLAKAREILDVRPYAAIRREMSQVQAAYNRLRSNGTASLAELAQASIRVRDRMAALRGSMNGLGRNLQQAVAPLQGVARAFALAGGGIAVRGAIQQADAYSNLSARLRLATNGTEEFKAAQQEVLRIAQQTRQPLEAVGSLYARLSPALREVGGTQRDVTQFTETFGKALAVSGATAAESGSAILQLSQALSAGALRGEEFNAVNEAAPRFIKALADSLGVPRGALRAMAQEGQLTSDKLVQAIRFASGQIDQEFAQLPLTVEGSLTQLRNAVQRALGDRNAASGATQQIASAIQSLAENIGPVLEAVIRLGYIGGAVFGVQLVGAAVNAAKALTIYVAQLKTAISFMGLVQRAALLMQAAFVGYQIGAWARDNFQVVRDAGIYAVRGVLIGVEELKAGMTIAFARIVQAAESFKPALVLAFSAAFDQVKGIVANFYEAIAAGLRKVGAGDLAGTYADVAASIRASSGVVAAEASADIQAAAQRADAAVLAAKQRAKEGVSAIKSITDDQLAARFGDEAEASTAATPGVIVPGSLASDGKAAAKALKELQQQAKALREQLYPAAAAMAELEANLDILRKTGGDASELSRFADLVAEELVGGLDAATLAARRYEQQIGVLEALLDDGLITQERFNELAGRARQVLRDAGDEAKKASSAFEAYFDQDFSRDFSAGFGEAGAAIGQIVTRIEQLTKSTEAYNKARAEGGLTAAELAKLEQEQLSRQIGTYGDIANAAKSFFKQGSSGYKVLQAASRAFYAFELAQQAASVVATVANAQVKTAAHGTAASAAGAEAVATQATAGPYVGFALAAAMAAFLASMGIGIGRGGGSSAPPSAIARPDLGAGTGTVLGDPTAQTESLANSLDALEKYAELDLGYSAQQLQALRSINAAITGVSSLLYRANAATGGATPFNLASTQRANGLAAASTAIGSLGGLFGSTATNLLSGITTALLGSVKTEQIATGILLQGGQTLGNALSDGLDAVYYQTIQVTRSSLFGLIRSSETQQATAALGSELAAQMGLVLGGLADTALEAVSALGGDLNAALRQLDALRLGTVRIDLQGLSAEDAQAKLEAVFGGIGDTIAATLLPAVAQFQQAGEGAFETLLRVASETRIVAQRIDSLGLSLGSLTGLDLAAVGQRLVDLAGGIDTFSEATNTYFSEFYSEEEQTESLRQQLIEAVDALGYALPAARAGFRELISSLDLTTERGQEAFTGLIQLAGAADRYYDTLDEAMEKYADAAKGLQSFRESIRQLTETANGATLDSARQRFENGGRLARLGNLDALQSLPELGRAFASASLAQSVSRTEYLRDIARIQLTAAQAETVATRLSMSEIAAEQLAEQKAQTVLLSSINDSLAGGAGTPAVAVTVAKAAAVQPQGSADATEIAALRAEIRELRATVSSLVVQLTKTNANIRILEQWDAVGLPEVRTA